jgi:acyl carrier protein
MDHQTLTPGPRQSTGTADDALRQEVAALIVTALNLDIEPTEINPDDPLYGDGLGLDSIDILEVALEVSKRFGFQLRADNEDNVRIFRSLASLADHVAQHRTK